MAPAPAASGPLPTLAVEVVWADITQVDGDVYTVGHYEQVLPQSAELALDRVVSGPGAGGQLVLTNLARRGILRGALGEVALFPWAAACVPADPGTSRARGRLVAVAGMGHPGSFNPLALRRLARNLAWTVSSLPDVRTVCTVLIGGGGNLSLADAVYGLMAGMADAIAPAIWRAPVARLRIVEKELGRARAIHRQLLALRDAREIAARIHLDVDASGVRTGEGGDVGTDYAMALTLAAAAAAVRGDPDRRQALDRLLDAVRSPERFPEWVGRRLATLGPAPGTPVDAGPDGALPADPDLAALAARLSIRIDQLERTDAAPTRLSFVRDGGTVCAAALTDTTVIPERRFEVDDALLTSMAGALTNPTPDRLTEVSTFFTRLVVPRDFRAVLERAAQLTIEVDRDLARLPWEMLSDRVDRGPDARPVALKGPMARQLRTAYSPPPGAERVAHWPLRALVVGDPGDPARGAQLPGARREAFAVAELLGAKGCRVTLMAGAPGAARDGDLRGVPPADRLAVLMELMSGEYDLLHYAGHGGFDPLDPATSGWVFADGLLTSRLLERVDVAPSLVVANACLSARTSDALQRGGAPGAARTEADLLPGLADEFFKRGVRNYVGTAWPVDDGGAVTFARTFYDALLPDPVGAAPPLPVPVGAALHAARQALHARVQEFGSLWAAYQHYGDPQHTLLAAEPRPDRC